MTEGDDRAFDIDRFVRALDAARTQRQLSWRDVARAVGVSASTITRLRQGAKPDLDTFFNLCRWAGLNPKEFDAGQAPSEPVEGSLTAISAVLRADPKLGKDDAELLEELLSSAYRRMTRTE